VVLIHGGGFAGGSRVSPDLDRIARGLARRGMVVANIDYRVIPQDPVTSERVAPAAEAFPDVPIFNAMVAAIDDTLTAVDWLRARAAKLRIDKRRLGLVGSSAGAITADHVAYVLDDLGIRGPRVSFAGSLWGGIFFDVDSNAAQLERGEAPLFAVHGDADSVVPVFLDDRLVARARKVGVPAEYHRVPGGGHGFEATGFFTREVRPGQTAFDRMLRFAERALW
jgi:acetyl esterase/lipase